MPTDDFSGFLSANPPEETGNSGVRTHVSSTVEASIGVKVATALSAFWMVAGTGYFGDRRLYFQTLPEGPKPNPGSRDIESWNGDSSWRLLFPEPSRGGPVFFGETCFGDQIRVPPRIRSRSRHPPSDRHVRIVRDRRRCRGPLRRSPSGSIQPYRSGAMDTRSGSARAGQRVDSLRADRLAAGRRLGIDRQLPRDRCDRSHPNSHRRVRCVGRTMKPRTHSTS